MISQQLFPKTVLVITQRISYQCCIKKNGICFLTRSESLDGSRNIFPLYQISFDDLLRTALFRHFQHTLILQNLYFHFAMQFPGPNTNETLPGQTQMRPING